MDSSNSSESSSRTWASGRRLSKVQRERKQASDRKRVREKRDRIAVCIATLETRLADVTAERDLLRQNMVLMSHALNNNPDAHGVPQGQPPTEILYNDPLQETPLDYAYNSPDIPLLARSMDPMTSFISFPEGDDGVIPASVTHPILPIEASTPRFARELPSLGPYIQESALSSSSNKGQASDCQRILGKPVRMARRLTAKDVCTDASWNDHALIKGIKEGWASLEPWRDGSLCPLWSAIKTLDMRIFGQAPLLTRLPCLKMVHSMLLCMVKAISVRDLPVWYRPVKAQYDGEHPFAADLLPWPGLRKRAVREKELTQTNQFWTQLVYQFRLGFPADKHEDDAVSFDKDNNQWSFTGLFLHHMYEIREWHMDLKFFEAWPKTYYDIVPLPEIGRSLSLPATAGSTSSPSDYQWRTAFVSGSGTGTGDRSGKAQWHAHGHFLPLPVRHSTGKLLESDDEDEEEESWHVLPWWS